MSAIEKCIEAVAQGSTIISGGSVSRSARAELAALREVAEAARVMSEWKIDEHPGAFYEASKKLDTALAKLEEIK